MGYFGSLLISIDFAWIVSRIWLDIDADGTGLCQGHRVKLALIWQASFVINFSQFYAHRSVIGWTKRPVHMSFGHLQLSSWCWSWITIGIICWQLSLCLARDVASVGNNATKVLTFLSSTQLQCFWREPLPSSVSSAKGVYSMKWFFYFWSPNKKICRNDESEMSATAAAAKCHCLWEQLDLLLLLLPWGDLWPELSHSLHLGVAIKREHRLTVSWANCEALLLGGWHFLVAKSLFIGRCHLSELQSTHIFNGDY